MHATAATSNTYPIYTQALLTVCGKSHPWPFSTKSTAGNAEGFLGRLPPHPAAADFIHSLLNALAGSTNPVAWLDGSGNNRSYARWGSFGTLHPGVAGFCFIDGSVRFLKEDLTDTTMDRLMTISGGVSVGDY